MTQKLYTEMTADEQLRYVTDLTTFIDQKLPRLERLGDAWEQADRKDMETGLALLSAFQFARDYAARALYAGDYSRRVHRLRYYVDKVKNEVAKGLAITGADGHTYAIVRPTVPARRRGRPTKEELAARQQGILPPQKTDAEMEKQMKIAALMGINVMVQGEPPREKNNVELAQERAARQAEYDRQNPSLFSEADGSRNVETSASRNIDPTAEQPAQPSSVGGDAIATPAEPAAPSYALSDVFAQRILNDRLHLNQLAFLLPKELAERTATVQGLRTAAAANSERAKLLAEQGADPDTIKPYATEAQRCVEAYEQIYDDVDRELATVYYRLKPGNDDPYVERFKKRFTDKIDIPQILHITHPYFQKQPPEFEATVRLLIEEESPEHAAKVKAEEERQEKIAALRKYITRTDKKLTKVRLQGLRDRIAEMRTLDAELADALQPILNKAEEDFAAEQAAKATTDQATEGANKSSKKQPTKEASKESKKPASKRAKKADAESN